MGIEACDVDIIGISYEPTILRGVANEHPTAKETI